MLLSILSCAHWSRAQQPASERTTATAPPAPAWLASAVIYEVFPRNFSQEGTLNAVTARIDTLQQLGVNVLWIMPIHPIGKLHRIGALGSPYAVQDYYAIDPDLGTKADFHRLVQTAHAHGMRVILDMVINHTAWDSVMMTHPQFYKHDAAGRIASPNGWSDVAALNYDNPELRDYMNHVFTYWLKDSNLDGFRCDAASFVPTAFWDQLSPQLHAIRPDLLLLAEASKPELMRTAFNLDYCWPLLSTFNEVLEHGEPASAIRTRLAEQDARFPRNTQHMLISDDHDEQRATLRYGAEGALAASALVFTLPGVPLLYNGMEVGDATPSGAPALFEKRPLYWGAAGGHPSFPDFYRTLIPLRAASPALQHGDLLWLHNSDEQHVVTYLRRAPEETDLVAVNLSNTPFRGTVELAAGDLQEVVFSSERRHSAASGAIPIADPLTSALPALSLEAFGVRIFRRQAPQHP